MLLPKKSVDPDADLFDDLSVFFVLAAHELLQKSGWKKVAILSSSSSAYSVGLAKYFKETYVAGGGTLTAEQKYAEGDKDFKAQLTAIKAAGADAICVPGYYTEAGLIVRQARDLGITVPMFGGDGWEAPELITTAGADRVITGQRCTGVDAEAGTAHFVDAASGAALPSQQGRAVIDCEGIHSVVRKQLYPDEGPPKYAGINMWRGVTRWKPIASGASMMRIGWHHPAKVLLYPIRNNIDAEGRQLVNWVIDIETPEYAKNDWNRPGNLDDFIHTVADWHFDWLDVPHFIRSADAILEYPMVDQDPLPRWNHGRVTLLGDAAHPMYPRGANGAAQAILDARALHNAIVTLMAMGGSGERAQETINPAEWLRTTAPSLQLLAPTWTVDVLADASVPAVRCNSRDLERAITNLVINARDASPVGSRIRVRCARCGQADGAARAAVEQDWVCMSVEDQGVGIPKDKLAMVFDGYYTTKGSRGNGLGLPTVKAVMRRSGGHVDIHSEPGVGTVVTLRFPAYGQSRVVA